MFSSSGPPATWRGEACFCRRGSASHCAMSVTGVVKFGSPVRKHRSNAAGGLAATTCACVRTSLSVALGAVATKLLSHVVHGEERLHRHGRHLRRRRGQQAGAVAPHHLVVVIAVRGVDARTLGERAPDVVDALLVEAARVDDRQLAQVRAARHDARAVRDRQRLRVGDGARRSAVARRRRSRRSSRSASRTPRPRSLRTAAPSARTARRRCRASCAHARCPAGCRRSCPTPPWTGRRRRSACRSGWSPGRRRARPAAGSCCAARPPAPWRPCSGRSRASARSSPACR